jgi:hypothetical protein
MLGNVWLGLIAGSLLHLVGIMQTSPSQGLAANPGPRICWQEGQRLRWSDFRAKSYPKSSPYDGSKMAAISAVGVAMEAITVKGVHTYRVDCVFVRDSSWVNNKAIKNAEDRAKTLTHEQLHFDIAELQARKLRQRIAQGLQAGEDLYSPPAAEAIARLQTEGDALDNRFDEEIAVAGGHKMADPVHKRWQLRLTQELNTLAAYKSTATNCP